MNILVINASPKKRFSCSGYLAGVLKGFLAGHHVQKTTLAGPRVYNNIFSQFAHIDALVLAMPLYVDGVPSHVLRFMQQAETVCRENNYNFKVYAVANCGFYEGRQCKNELDILHCWCQRSGLQWCGGIGIGAGPMLGILRITPILSALLWAVRLLATALAATFQGRAVLPALAHAANPTAFLISIGVSLAFSFGAFWRLWQLKSSIKKGLAHTNRYTTITCCPRFLYVAFASLFWVVSAAFKGVPLWRMFQKRKLG